MAQDNEKGLHSHLFNIDEAAWTPGAMWWLVDKQQPDRYVLRLTPEEGDLVMSGFYRKQGLRFQYNGAEGWLSTSIYDRVQRRRKMPMERVGLSRRDFQDGEQRDDVAKARQVAATFRKANADHAANHELVLVSANPCDVRVVLAELRRALQPAVDDFTGTVRLRYQCAAARAFTAQGVPAYLRHAYEALELAVGLRIAKGSFEPVDLPTSDLVCFYTDATDQVEALRQAPFLLRNLLQRTPKALAQEVREWLAKSHRPRALRIMQTTTNERNPFVVSDVPLAV